MSDLRTRLIRLAHSNPELRPHVLPLVAERTAGKTANEAYSVREATRVYDAFAKEFSRVVGASSDVTVRGDILVQGPREFTGIRVVGDDPKDPQYAVWLHAGASASAPYHVEIRAFKWPGGRGRIRAWEDSDKAYTEEELMGRVLPYITGRIVKDMTRGQMPRTAAKTYNVEDAAWLFNWLTKKVVQAARPYKLPVKAEVVSQGASGFKGVIRIGDDPLDREPFDRNSSMHLTVKPVPVGSGHADLVRHDVELLNGDGKRFGYHSDYDIEDFKRQSARAVMEDLAIILSSNDKVEREWLAERAMGRTAAWENLPEGWTEDSVQSFWDSMTGDVKHKITKCMKQMDGKVTDTGAFCGSLASQVGYRAASADTMRDATALRRAAVRVAHEDASTRGVILARMPR